jgi:putative phage-type endonuclease
METSQAVTSQAVEPTSEEKWLAERKLHVTATDIPRILGLSRFGGPTSVYFDKVPAEIEAANIPPRRLEGMTWGRRLEEAIITAFAERTGQTVHLADPHNLVICGPDPLLACSLDSWVPETMEPVDAKNIRSFNPEKWGEDGTDAIPDDYSLQLAVQMLCTGGRRAFLPVLFSGQELRIYHVEHDPDVETMILESAHDFWERYVVPRIPPPPDGSSAYTEHLSRALRQRSGNLVAVDDSTTIEWALALRDAREQEAEIAKVVEEAEQNLKERIGSAAGLTGPGFRITWKQAAGSPKTNWEAVARTLGADFPAILGGLISEHTTTKAGSRRFLPTFTTQDKE